jgi:hypothetical protein
MPATYQIIATATGNGSSSTVMFSSIPQTFTDLVLRASIRTGSGGSNDYVRIMINNDSLTTIYTTAYVEGTGVNNGSSVAARVTNGINQSYPNVVAGSSLASRFGNLEFYLPNYTSSLTKQASTFAINKPANEQGASLMLCAHRLNFTSAINRIDITSASGGNYVSGSTFYLYGIKNS